MQLRLGHRSIGDRVQRESHRLFEGMAVVCQQRIADRKLIDGLQVGKLDEDRAVVFEQRDRFRFDLVTADLLRRGGLPLG